MNPFRATKFQKSASHASGQSRSPRAPRNPYVGARAFREEDASVFFGREKQLKDLRSRVEKRRFVALTGAPGSGKTSLTRGGLVASLAGGWRVAYTRPGATPLRSLAAAMASLTGEESGADAGASWEAWLWSRYDSGRGLQVKRGKSRGRALLIIDQAEELFTLAGIRPESAEETAACLQLLERAAGSRGGPKILFVISSQYLPYLGSYPELAKAVYASLVELDAPADEALRGMIEKPALAAGARVADDLSERILADRPNSLTRLEHALMRAFEMRLGDGDIDAVFGVSHYERAGGARFAMEHHAESLFGGFRDRESDAIEKIFRGLSEFGPESIHPEPRAVGLRELAAVCGLSIADAGDILEEFARDGRNFIEILPLPGDDRLILPGRALLETWPAARAWCQAEEESARVFRRLLDSSRLHAEGKIGLYRHPELGEALRWRADNEPTEAWARRYGGGLAEALRFLEMSRARYGSRGGTREDIRRAVAAAVLLALVFGGGYFTGDRGGDTRPESRARHSVSTRPASFTPALKDETPELLLPHLNKREAALTRVFDSGSEHIAAKTAPKTADLPGRNHTGSDTNDPAVKSRSDAVIARLERRDQEDEASFTTRVKSEEKQAPTPGAYKSLISGRYVLRARLDGALELKSGKNTLSRARTDLRIFSLALSRDGSIFAAGGADGRIQVYNRKGTLLAEFKNGAGVMSLALSYDGQTLVSGGVHGSVKLWNVQTRQVTLLQKSGLHAGIITRVRISRRGELIAAASADGQVRVWDRAGKRLSELRHQGRINRISFSPDEKIIAMGAEDGSVRVWNRYGRTLGAFEAEGPVLSLRLRDDRVTTATRVGGRTLTRTWDWNRDGGNARPDSTEKTPAIRTETKPETENKSEGELETESKPENERPAQDQEQGDGDGATPENKPTRS